MTGKTTTETLDKADVPSDQQWVPNSKIKWQFDIDIVGTCNLRCPSCPVGNLREAGTSEKYMRPEMLDSIITKAKSECRVYGVYLYNWTEPFLHPNLADMIQIVRSHGIPCGISTNLNILKNIDDVMEADLQMFKVSVSGFTQDVYSQTHRRGDIEVVKRNMAEVAKAKKRTGSSVRLVVAYHRYLGNHEDEEAMREYAESLGYEFEPAWAYLMPLEKMLAFVDNDAIDVEINEEDQHTIDRLALPLADAVEAAKNTNNRVCPLRAKQMAITASGDVMLCCTAFNQDKYKLGSFLDTPLDDLQAMKYSHDLCGACMKNGLHEFFTYGSDELDDIGLANVRSHYPDAKLKSVKQMMGGERPRGFAAVPFKIKREVKRIVNQVRAKL
ncbi:MAG: radical SAM protein [Magnetovibrio sp.]|nr:radical SAM protein [Magnetovibrio sp.]